MKFILVKFELYWFIFSAHWISCIILCAIRTVKYHIQCERQQWIERGIKEGLGSYNCVSLSRWWSDWSWVPLQLIEHHQCESCYLWNIVFSVREITIACTRCEMIVYICEWKLKVCFSLLPFHFNVDCSAKSILRQSHYFYQFFVLGKMHLYLMQQYFKHTDTQHTNCGKTKKHSEA